MEKEIVNKTKNREFTESNKGISVISLILNYYQHKKFIWMTTLAFCVLSVILYFFILDPIFYSSATIKSNAKSTFGFSGIEMPDLSDLEGFDISTGKSSRELASYEKILTSRRCIEEFINRFNIKEQYEIRYTEDAIKYVTNEIIELKQDKLSSTLTIGANSKDPVLSKEMVEFLIDRLDKINIEMNIYSAKKNREFIEGRYINAKNNLTSAEDTLKLYQSIYGISPELQAKASAESAFMLENQIKAEEVKLDVLKGLLAPDQVEVKSQEKKINALRSQLTQIQNSTNLNDILRLGNSPQIVMNFLRLKRDVEIQTKIMTFLLPLFEQSKIEEHKETPTVLILDYPNTPERKSKPKRLTSVFMFTVAGFFLSYAFIFMFDKWKLFRYKLISVRNTIK